jgi:hypothetical protein
VLLPGADTDSALSGTSDHGPFAVPADEWNGDFVSVALSDCRFRQGSSTEGIGRPAIYGQPNVCFEC